MSSKLNGNRLLLGLNITRNGITFLQFQDATILSCWKLSQTKFSQIGRMKNTFLQQDFEMLKI